MTKHVRRQYRLAEKNTVYGNSNTAEGRWPNISRNFVTNLQDTETEEDEGQGEMETAFQVAQNVTTRKSYFNSATTTTTTTTELQLL